MGGTRGQGRRLPKEAPLSCNLRRLSNDTFVFEREWENLAAIEAAYDRLFAQEGAKSLAEAAPAIKADSRMEFYSVLEP